jgi:hypothetical protein
MLVRHVSYRSSRPHWPTADDQIAPIVDAHRKIVFSSTLPSVDWQSAQLATASPADEIAALKRRPGKTIGVSGGPEVRPVATSRRARSGAALDRSDRPRPGRAAVRRTPAAVTAEQPDVGTAVVVNTYAVEP